MDKRAVLAELKAILETMTTEPPDAPGGQNFLILSGSDSKITISNAETAWQMVPEEGMPPTVFVVGDGVTLLNNMSKSLAEDAALTEAADATAMFKALKKLLQVAYFAEPECLQKLLQEMLDDLLASVKEWEVMIPICNLHLQHMDGMRLGEVLFRRTEAAAGEALLDTAAILVSGKGERQALGSGLRMIMTNGFSVVYEQPTVASVVVRGGPSKANELAEARVDEALNVLRLYGRLYHGGEGRAYIGRIGQIMPAAVDFRPLIEVESRSRGEWKFQTVGFLHPFNVDAEFVEFTEKLGGLDTFCSILERMPADRTAIERQLLTALTWSGSAPLHYGNHVEFLHYCIALESLLLKKDENGELSRTFSERLAYLLGRTPSNCETLEAIGRDIYNQRSRIVHQGQLQVSEEQLGIAARYTFLAVLEMCRHTSEWTTQDDFVDWIRKTKYASVGDSSAGR